MKLFINYLLIAVFAPLLFTSCGANTKNTEPVMTKEKAPYEKKYTNKDFYKDGKLIPEVALQAYLDMFDYYGIPYNDFLKKNLWITDFELGDFENVGMAGVFWVNDAEHKYFGHEIYLLPNQMIVEHRHLPTEFNAKYESWLTRDGWCYNFSIGEPTPDAPALPKSQEGHITVAHFVKQMQGEINHLVEIESPHFLMAGPEGAVVTEFGTFHDGNGLRFTNPKVEFTDILTKGK